MQVFDSATKSLKYIVDFYEQLETVEEILHNNSDVAHTNKNPISLVQSTNQPHRISKKVLNRLVNPWKRTLKIK